MATTTISLLDDPRRKTDIRFRAVV